MVWCLRLGITPSQYDDEDVSDWNQWEQMLGIERRFKKQIRWD